MYVHPTDLQPGDIVVVDPATDITVDSIEVQSDGGLPQPRLVVVYGRVTRGATQTTRTQRWVHHADDGLDICRQEVPVGNES